MPSRLSAIESPAKSLSEARPRRRCYRQKIRTLAPVNLDSATGGILRDLNQFGIAIQTVGALVLNQQVHLRFDLSAPRVRVEATGRVAWTDSWGQAGVQFVELPPRCERQLKEWIFAQILSAAYLFSPNESLVVEGNHAEGATELLFSPSPRPAITLAPPQRRSAQTNVRVSRQPDIHTPNLHHGWCPVPLSMRTLAKLLDGLIQLCAILLFAVMAMAITNVLPTWPIALVLACGVTAVFVALYRFLFVFWIRSTPGQHLAKMACLEHDAKTLQEESSRFR